MGLHLGMENLMGFSSPSSVTQPVNSLPRATKHFGALTEWRWGGKSGRSPRCRRGQAPFHLLFAHTSSLSRRNAWGSLCSHSDTLGHAPGSGLPVSSFAEGPAGGMGVHQVAQEGKRHLEPPPHTAWPETPAPAMCCEEGSLDWCLQC